MVKMRYCKVLIIVLLILVVFCCSANAEAEDSLKTDVKIITSLGSGGFFTPALVKNNSLVYNRFEFNLYTNTNNTTYEIKLENSTIKLGKIVNFKYVFYYNMTLDYINLLEVNIGNHTYSYSNIQVVAYSIMNRSRFEEDEEEKLSFTKEEFERIISEIEIKAFVSNLLGIFLAGGVVYYYVTEYKKYVPEVIA